MNGDNWQVITGDCLDVMRGMDANSVDTIITDPPYGLSFMGKDWDHGIPGVPFWQAALHVAKPGATLLAFGGTRTFHRLTVAIEDAGWEIRDTVMWLYGSGFPKSLDISKAIDKANGAERELVGISTNGAGNNGRGLTSSDNRSDSSKGMFGEGHNEYPITAPATPAAQEWDGYGTALKPSWEPIIVAMKPLSSTFAANALEWGVAGLWIDGGRVPHDEPIKPMKAQPGGNKVYAQSGRYEPTTELKPSGRWPSNLVHDGSAEVLAGFPVTNGNGTYRPGSVHGHYPRHKYQGGPSIKTGLPNAPDNYGDTGSAARFFYCAKASRAERNAGLEGMPKKVAGAYGEFAGDGRGRQTEHTPAANGHPTVKPLALMRYLCRLTKTPTGGVVLDPFAGSGSTGCAAVMEGRSFIGIELSDEYAEIARARIAHAEKQVPVAEQGSLL